MSKHKRIVIVGHMGAGKSLLGQTLAEKLGWTAIDANIGIERYIGRHLDDIIGKQGSESFYQCQSEILKHYLAKENVVIVTEDSYILNEKNRQLLKDEFVVYLNVTTPVQIERMSTGPAALLPKTDLKSFLDKLHQERDHLFEEVSTIVVESQNLEEDIKKVLSAL